MTEHEAFAACVFATMALFGLGLSALSAALRALDDHNDDPPTGTT